MKAHPSRAQLTPMGDWFLIELITPPERMVSGIVMPGNDSRPEEYGRVVKVGSGFYQNGTLIPPRVHEGQTVMFHRGRGIRIRFDSDDVVWLTERDVLATVE